MLEQLEPSEVFYYFEEISKIPRGSGNTKAISDYCVEFAEKHSLAYIQDDRNNVIIVKEATKGRETDAGVILQGHLDMVTVKEHDVEHDFEKDPLKLAIDGDDIYAKGTSLGADDGVAVAYALAILASSELSHPRLEIILTVDEEIGLLGAAFIDLSGIRGKYLLNLDSEEEGVLWVGCAGGLRGDLKFPAAYESMGGIYYDITITGLLGGHSGTEIHKERANAIKLLGRFLSSLEQEICFGITALSGGEKDNAIPRQARIGLLVPEEETDALERILKREESFYQAEYAVSDKEIRMEAVRGSRQVKLVLEAVSERKLIYLLSALPNGVQHMSMDIQGLVETSLNLGILALTEEEFYIAVSIRSSVKSRKLELSDKICMMTEFFGGVYSIHGNYPEWAYRRESKLRETMVSVYETLFSCKPRLEAVHAGLECGILLEKCPELDAISFGPDIKDIHTPKERLSISSVQRTWNYLTAVLGTLS